MFEKNDFYIPNIANVPIVEDKIKVILEIFGDAYLKYSNINVKKYCDILNTTENTFRKIINHSKLFGILEKDGEFYYLSEISKMYYYEEIDFMKYLIALVENNNEIRKTRDILEILFGLFSGTLKKKTIIYIFSIVSTQRYDKSAISSMTRNLHPILSIFKEIGYIDFEKDNICWITDNKTQYNDFFARNDIVSVSEFQKLVQKYFSKNIALEIMRCVSSFENDRYIWAKSSLYKNKGEICNLNGEYIMSVMKKGFKYE